MLWIIGSLCLVAGFGFWLYDMDTPCALLSLVGCVTLYIAMIRMLKGLK